MITTRINQARRRLNLQLRQKNEELSQQKEMVERQRDELEEQRDKLLDLLSPTEESTDRPEAEPAIRNQFVEKFLQCVDRQIANSELTIENIGDEMGVSRVQLYRKIKAATGRTPIEIIRQERLRRAQTLLTDSSLSISEVAYRVGFSAPSYLPSATKNIMANHLRARHDSDNPCVKMMQKRVKMLQRIKIHNRCNIFYYHFINNTIPLRQKREVYRLFV